MNRKLRTALLLCMLMFCMAFTVNAVQDLSSAIGKPFAGFVLGNKLYAFFEAGGEVEEELPVALTGTNAEENAIPFTESRQYVHYYILLDVSGSVRNSSSMINEFVLKLMEGTKAKWQVTIMTLGESFNEVISSSMEDDAVERALKGIPYTDQKTNLYKGINSAINFIDEKERSRGDLYRLVLVTDGIPDGNTNTPAPEEVKRRVEARTDIVFDVIGVGQWEKGGEKDLPMSGREVILMKDSMQAEEAARKIADETDNLYTVCFEVISPIRGNSLDIKLWVKGNSNMILEQPNLTIIGREEAAKDDNSSGKAESGTERAETSENPVSTEPERAESDNTESGNTESDSGGTGVLAGIILLVMTLFFILMKALRRNKKIAPNHIRIKIISGKYASKKKYFPLVHTLIIGSGKECDIMWKESEVSAQNARIFIHEGMLRIEDLDSPCGTAINGMRIFAPNRLRSGDIVSIGNRVRFRVYFNLL